MMRWAVKSSVHAPSWAKTKCTNIIIKQCRCCTCRHLHLLDCIWCLNPTWKSLELNRQPFCSEAPTTALSCLTSQWQVKHDISLLWASLLPLLSSGSSTLQFRAERIKMPPTRYQRAAGSDRGTVEVIVFCKSVTNPAHPLLHHHPTPTSPGSLSHSECSSPTPPVSPVNLETSSFASSQSQGSISNPPRISVSPAPVGDRRKDG